MRTKNLLLLVCLFSSLTVWANNDPFSIISTIPAASDEVNCNQPAPFNFHIEEIGSTWVKYAWGGNAAFKHRVRTYRASDNALLNTTIVPAGNASVTINGLPSGTEIYGVINAICSDDSNSNYDATSNRGTTVILDLLVQGLQPPNPSSFDWYWSTIGTGTCPFFGSQIQNSYFKIYPTSNQNDSRIFGIRLSGTFHYKVSIHQSNNNDVSPFDFKCYGSDPQDSCTGINLIEIWAPVNSTPTIIGTITASLGAQTSTFSYTQANEGFRLENVIPAPGGRNSLTEGANIATASPNPFAESLDVFLSPSIENIHLQLFNLSGQKVLDRQFSGGQGQYTLSTAGLSPGFYMLRVEADGEVQTLKVVKSE